MNDDQLEDFIYQAKRATVPDCPGSVEQNVLRRIRLWRSESGQSAWALLFRILPQPGVIAAGLAIVAIVSSGITILENSSEAAEQNRQDLAARALGFDIFQQDEILNFDDH